MNYIAYFVRFLLRIKWWLILTPTIVALVVYIFMGNMSRTYRSQTTIYTGVVSGYDIENTTDVKQDWNVINNSIDNLINIISAQTTLRNVSMKLFAQHMMHGDVNRDNQYIKASNYRNLLSRTPKEVQNLIDKTSDSITLKNLFNYEKADHDNYVYGLFHWTHRHYSYEALKTIAVKRLNNSDMLEMSYINDDPGIVYNTLLFLNEEFRNQYQDLRFGETSNVIKYFEDELKRVGDSLVWLESDLKDYNVMHRVINYDEQTKHIAALSRDYELNYERILLENRSATELYETIEKQLGVLTNFKNNAEFIQKLETISNLQSRIAANDAFSTSDPANTQKPQYVKGELRERMDKEALSLKELTANISSNQYTKEGISTPALVEQWLDATLRATKSKAELEVMKMRYLGLDSLYTKFSPVGSTLKQHQRTIDFQAQTFLSILQALNNARLRQKNLQMTSATLKTVNPPVLPIGAEPSKRKLTVFATFFVTLFFVLGFFILLEILDRTPHDKMRAERIIKNGDVIGAFPGKERGMLRRYDKIYVQIASQYMCNNLLNYLTPGGQNVINFVSTDQHEGKGQLVEMLALQLRERDLSVRVVSWKGDFDSTKKNFLMARSLSEFASEQKEGEPSLSTADVILIEYPPLTKYSLPHELLRDVAINVVAVRADKTWKDTDQLLYDKIIQHACDTPTKIFLTNTRHNVTEIFTGMLPPYTLLRRIIFQLGQFGFTASLK